jgi:hypothetical protein
MKTTYVWAKDINGTIVFCEGYTILQHSEALLNYNKLIEREDVAECKFQQIETFSRYFLSSDVDSDGKKEKAITKIKDALFLLENR